MSERAEDTAARAGTAKPSASEAEAASERSERAEDTAARAGTAKPSASEAEA
ncbi:hypothetical protein [Nocardia sp. CA-120079]|uniref:hypothetical protein n=1 Tax=Nocardia sp. CA-120079 TaxID=3239974 RepID=UPI003D9683A0